MSIRRRTHDRLCADIAAAPRSVVDNKLLAEALRQPLTDQARDYVDTAASGKADGNPHRLRRIGLRSRKPRDGGQRGGARGQMQDVSTVGKFHFEPPFTSFDHLVGAQEDRWWHHSSNIPTAHTCLKARATV